MKMVATGSAFVHIAMCVCVCVCVCMCMCVCVCVCACVRACGVCVCGHAYTQMCKSEIVYFIQTKSIVHNTLYPRCI